MSAPVRVAILNDYALVVAGVAGVFAAYPDRVTVVELDSQVPVISEVDIVLYDTFGQRQGEAMELDRLMQGSLARLVVFSWNTDPELVKQAFAAGAAGYVEKSVTAEGLVSALERVHAGEQVAPEQPATDGRDVSDDFGRWPGDEHGLAPREAEVLALICQGLSNEQIGERAFLGINTIKTYTRTLYAKIDVESRTQAVLWGIDHGFRPDRGRRVQDNRDT